MRDDNMRVWEQLAAERRKVDKLINVIGRLWDIVGKSFPGMVPPFPNDPIEASESPNIYITSPTATSRYPPLLSMNMHSMHSMGSPNSSPTAADFPSSHMHHGHPHHFHSLSQQHSFQHISSYHGDSTSLTPLQSSPGSISMELFDDGTGDPPPSGRSSSNRQRVDESGTGVGVNNSPDSMSMMSSVSSPGSNTGLGWPVWRCRRSRVRLGATAHAGVRRRALAARRTVGAEWSWSDGPTEERKWVDAQRDPNIGNMTRNNNASMPLLSITTQG
ncbi:hypothetical protein CPB84DRAFT_1836505 [Gymnopilus junonius]|uniref:Uncharacterized protein n=1 Tax=Gymnopilus junonius TaxID=109634 RepID=A0A9P5TM59_GYMJU|nr:hypothetical protein CPB84DRAFT_1836505 [Gymnopilus junonius]